MFAHSNVTVRVGINKLRLERRSPISKTPRSLRIPGSKSSLAIIPRAAAARSAGREPTARLSIGVRQKQHGVSVSHDAAPVVRVGAHPELL